MATMTISLPDPMKDWIEARIKEGEYASSSDYVRDLVRRDRERRAHPDLIIDDLRRMVADSRASGIGSETVSSLLAEAKKKARTGDRRKG
ncbi:MAG: type II toxin-antitoxin system ParD family antitoxin [Hyphomicrobiales bacterium]|nr:type II toxin-antitoxin system ParD family antitoxin [Hyphomicrobiales bacterium]